MAASCDHHGAGRSPNDDGSATTGLKPEESEKISAFLSRCGLRPSVVPRMHEFARERVPGRDVVAAPFQGFCSYTLLLAPLDRRDSGCEVCGGDGGGGGLVQFRPRRHGIDVRVCEEARGILGNGVVPCVRELGVLEGLETVGGGTEGVLVGYLVERVGGVSLSSFGRGCMEGRRRVVRDLARVFADSWRGRQDIEDVVRGKVGGSLRWRLGIMCQGLPREFRGVARRVLREMGDVEGLPWVITHGDLVPDNIMVRPPTDDGTAGGELVGLIDWAEAEWLPFGVGMYGLEEVLGEDVDGSGRFEYYPEAGHLRAAFWEEVGKAVDDEEVVRRAKWAQVLGVLSWRGIAFDDGALERVVEVERDWWDVWRLRMWLFGPRWSGINTFQFKNMKSRSEIRGHSPTTSEEEIMKYESIMRTREVNIEYDAKRDFTPREQDSS